MFALFFRLTASYEELFSVDRLQAEIVRSSGINSSEVRYRAARTHTLKQIHTHAHTLFSVSPSFLSLNGNFLNSILYYFINISDALSIVHAILGLQIFSFTKALLQQSRQRSITAVTTANATGSGSGSGSCYGGIQEWVDRVTLSHLEDRVSVALTTALGSSSSSSSSYFSCADTAAATASVPASVTVWGWLREWIRFCCATGQVFNPNYY